MPMLALMPGEIQIMEVPLKKNKTLSASNTRIVVYGNDGMTFAAPIETVRSVTPIKKDAVRIQHYSQKADGSAKREFSDYKLHDSKYSAAQVCHKIVREYEKLETFATNAKGLLILKPHEHIITTYSDAKTNQGKGLLYVTNLGIALEVPDEGVVCDVPFENFSLVTALKKKKIRIVWYEGSSKFKFDFEIGAGRDDIMSMMQNALDQHRTNTGYHFLQLEQKYSKLTPDEFYALAQSANPEFFDYLRRHAIHTFGFYAVKFTDGDESVIMACKMLGYPIEMISDISDEEMNQRKTTYDSALRYTNFIAEWRGQKAELDSLEKQCSTADDLKVLQKTEKYKKIQESMDSLCRENSEFGDYGAYKMELQASAWGLQADDRRSQIIYEKWCESNPLPDISDDVYDESWVRYLSEKLNNSKGRNPLVTSHPHFEHLQDDIKTKNRNASTLEMFTAPEGIPDEDIYNNCWHDRRSKMWYVQNDNLNEHLRNAAVSDPDHSQHVCGRRVWGFSEDVVEMFCGLPAVSVQYDEKDYYYRVKVSRRTGREVNYLSKAILPFILPILREEDVTEERASHNGKWVRETSALAYSVDSTGSELNRTPKEYELYCKKWGFVHLPIAERVRRAVFSVMSGITLEEIETEKGMPEELTNL